MGIADHSCAPAPSRAILPEEAVGAGALDSPFLGAARFEFIQTMWATKGRSYKKIIADRRYHNSSLLTPHSSLLTPHSTNDKIYKKLIKFFDK